MRSARTIIIWSGSVIIGLALVSYVMFVSFKFARGPALTFTYPDSGISTTSPFISIEGTVARVASITLNGRAIFADQSGRFLEKLLLHPGYNIIEARASDRFERYVERRLELILLETTDNTSTPSLQSPTTTLDIN